MININGETLHTSDQKISTCLETEPADDEGCQRSKVLHSGRWKEIRSEKNLEEITNLLIDDAWTNTCIDTEDETKGAEQDNHSHNGGALRELVYTTRKRI